MTPVYNRAEVEGRVISLGEPGCTAWGSPLLSFVLEVARPRRGSDRVPCCALDAYAEELAGRICVGDVLHVDGVLRWNAQRRTLGICLRPPHGAWWTPKDDGVPGDSMHIAQGGHIAAPVSGPEVPPEHESVRETAERVRRELEDVAKRRPGALFSDDWYGEDEPPGTSESTPRAVQSGDKTCGEIGEPPRSGDGEASCENEDDAVKRIAQEIEDFMKMKEAQYGR